MGLIRKKPIAKRRAKKRTYKTPRCDVRGCRKPQDVKWDDFPPRDGIGGDFPTSPLAHGQCRSHAKAEADRRFSLFIRQRDGKCLIPTDKPCVGPLQCCHLLSRRFGATRYDERNAVAGCAGHHAYWTVNPDRWAAFLDTWPRLKFLTLHELRQRAFSGDPMDLADVLVRHPAVPK